MPFIEALNVVWHQNVPHLINIFSIRYPLIHQEDQDEDTAEACFLEFHASHGKNIGLSNLNLTASRTASYNQGIVLSHKPLIRNHVLKVCMSLMNHVLKVCMSLMNHVLKVCRSLRNHVLKGLYKPLMNHVLKVCINLSGTL